MQQREEKNEEKRTSNTQQQIHKENRTRYAAKGWISSEFKKKSSSIDCSLLHQRCLLIASAVASKPFRWIRQFASIWSRFWNSLWWFSHVIRKIESLTVLCRARERTHIKKPNEREKRPIKQFDTERTSNSWKARTKEQHSGNEIKHREKRTASQPANKTAGMNGVRETQRERETK